MTDTTRTPKEIEREIEEQRSDLSSNLEDLQDKFSIDTVVHQIADQFREHGGDMGRSISEQVKANPIPLALTGIGLAWMMFGNSQKTVSDNRASSHDYAGTDVVAPPARLNQRHPQSPPPAYRSSAHQGPSWSHDNANEPSTSDRFSDTVATTKDQMSKQAAAVKNEVSSAASSVSDATSAAGDKMADVASSAKSKLDAGVDAAKRGVSSAGNRIAEGTEALSDEGRQRVIAARRKAIEFRHQTARSVNQGADAAADFYDRQPLVIGALALAVGAALGGALPRTKTEDNLMGAQSDDLINEAERIFEEEKSKVMSVAQTVTDEAKDIASATKADLDSGAPGQKTAGQAVGEKAKSAATRVADAAKAKAQDENLGKPKI
ncbi:DUF3618 domain-containing protein [Pararhizobium sp. IMCC21322]|uniref:DUF3618 domain-containing protein n=1 Tax=Pararhizobium sp. IMCC21322 TaxID=3067903 RepID=UPI00274207D0|nr:DUF3618 domain-containing protein [Pararhizobium sp. IMCC21322]